MNDKIGLIIYVRSDHVSVVIKTFEKYLYKIPSIKMDFPRHENHIILSLTLNPEENHIVLLNELRELREANYFSYRSIDLSSKKRSFFSKILKSKKNVVGGDDLSEYFRENDLKMDSKHAGGLELTPEAEKMFKKITEQFEYQNEQMKSGKIHQIIYVIIGVAGSGIFTLVGFFLGQSQ